MGAKGEETPPPTVWMHTGLFQHALAIGRVSITYVHAEALADALLVPLIPLQDNESAATVLSNMDFLNKLDVLKVLGYARFKDKPDDWYRRLDCTVKLIKKLGEQRNRLIHDLWLHDGTQAVRLYRSPALQRPQAHEELQVVLNKVIPVPLSEIEQLEASLAQCLKSLVALIMETAPPALHERSP